jgi:hypothetical protein
VLDDPEEVEPQQQIECTPMNPSPISDIEEEEEAEENTKSLILENPTIYQAVIKVRNFITLLQSFGI